MTKNKLKIDKLHNIPDYAKIIQITHFIAAYQMSFNLFVLWVRDVMRFALYFSYRVKYI